MISEVPTPESTNVAEQARRPVFEYPSPDNDSNTDVVDDSLAVETSVRTAKTGFIRRMAQKAFGRSELAPEDPAPLGYTDSGEPKEVRRVTVIHPDGDKPNTSFNIKNW